MQETIILQDLDKRKVNVLIQKSMEVEGQVVPVSNHRCAYINSARGREQLTAELPEPYRSAVLAVWDDTPTVSESPSPEQPNQQAEGSRGRPRPFTAPCL